MFGALGLPALSQSSDSIEVTMAPNVILSATVDTESINYGSLELSPSNVSRTVLSLPQTYMVRNTSNIPANLMISGTDGTTSNGSTWILNCDPADTGTVGNNQYVHRFWNTNGGSLATAEALCSDGDKLLEGSVTPWTEANGIMVGFRLQLNMPTGTTGYGVRTSTVIVTAVQP
jgi:hypothetical protein